ncbi:MAG: TolC family protein [Acidobacteriaceae bacterium]|nr:TolC family protein [Acidobacteriaceae bacterium]
MKYQHAFRIVGIVGLAVLCASPKRAAAEARRLTLEEAVHLAVSQNRALKIARLKVEENQQNKAGDRSDYFPKITNQSNALHVTELQNVVIPAGGFGLAGGALIPPQQINLQQGKQNLFSSGTMITQPLTQLIRIRQQNRIAAAEVTISRDDVKRAENEIAVQAHTLYYGILVAQLQKKAAEQQTEYASENLRESEQDVRKGSALKVVAIGSRAELLEGQQSVLTADLQLADLKTELNDLLGLPLDTELELDPAVPTSFDTLSKMEYTKIAWAENPQILAAEETVRKARAGVAAAKTAYIPDITAFARHSYQDGVPFLVHNFGTFGVSLSYDVFDFGKRRAAVRERNDALAEAQLDLDKLKDEVAVSVQCSYNKLERTKSMVDVARQVMNLRDESDRLAGNQLTYGVVNVSDRRQASAARYKAQADLLQASLAHLLARAELEQAAGRTPGL